MTLQQLRYVDGIARSGSISEAAKRLYVSQPSLSNSVLELEREIGLRLFERSARGACPTQEGEEFLGYARQVLEQARLLEDRYVHAKPPKRLFSVSSQHYAFVVSAFVEAIHELETDEYECALRETRTHDIIEDVRLMRSEIGVIYTDGFNRRVIDRALVDAKLDFSLLFEARPHVFVSVRHPLAGKSMIDPDELSPFPRLSFDQGEHNSLYYSEEIRSAEASKKAIKVSDRATLFNLLIGLNGYTISTGVISSDLNGSDIIAVPLDLNDRIAVGYVTRRPPALSGGAQVFLEKLKAVCERSHSSRL
jgi:DNA-binding transcriptional LysR family regulator